MYHSLYLIVFFQNLVNMGKLSITADAVLPKLLHDQFKVETEMNICIHKFCPREKKSVFKSFKKLFASCCRQDREDEREYCRSEKLPSSMRQITEKLRERFEKKEIDYAHYI